MRSSSWPILGRALSVVLLVALPACKITWREPRLEPLNTNRFYAAELEATCTAARDMVQQFGLEVTEFQDEERACLVDTDWRVLPDSGEDAIDHLDEVAITGPGPFIGGRYTVTITGRASRDAGTRLKVVARIEGYVNEEFGYQVLRSKGLIESRMFAAVGTTLGTPAVESR